MPRGALGHHLERHAHRGSRAPTILANRGRKLVVGALAVLDEQSFLGRKMQKKGRARDIGPVADILDRNRIEPAPQKKVHSGIVDIGASAPFLALAPRNRRRCDTMKTGVLDILVHITRLQSIKRPQCTKQGPPANGAPLAGAARPVKLGSWTGATESLGKK